MSIVNNKKAYFEYFVLDEYEAGIVLFGAEVKSVRMGNVTLTDSFIYLKGDEVWLRNFKVSRYSQAHVAEPHDDSRDKKLLLTKREIARISRSLEDKGITCVPLSVFTKRNKVKIKIGVVKGKKLFDKRNTIKERDLKRELQRSL
jgi:SsrA-binding protein